MAKRSLEDNFRNIDQTLEYTYKQLAENWGCTRTAARQRVTTARKNGYKIKIIRAHKARPAKRPHKNFERGFGNRRGCIYTDDLGDPDLPICPNCERLGNVGENKQPVHLAIDRDDPARLMYCRACGYDPEYEEIIAFQERIAAAYAGHNRAVEVLYV